MAGRFRRADRLSDDRELVLSVSNVQLDQREPVRFVGIDNYTAVFNDRQAVKSMFVTLRFAVLWLPIAIVAPFVVALMLNSKYLMCKGAFRVLLFVPYVVPFVGDRVDLARHVW